MSITKKKITNRLYVISLLLIVIIFSIVFKIIDLQFFKGDYYIDISEKREFKNIEIPANRGNIYSDSGKLLASSVPKYDIRFDVYCQTTCYHFFYFGLTWNFQRRLRKKVSASTTPAGFVAGKSERKSYCNCGVLCSKSIHQFSLSLSESKVKG